MHIFEYTMKRASDMPLGEMVFAAAAALAVLMVALYIKHRNWR